MILLKILKDLLGEKFGKDWMVERARRAKVKCRYFSDNKKKGWWPNLRNSKRREEYERVLQWKGTCISSSSKASCRFNNIVYGEIVNVLTLTQLSGTKLSL